MSRRNAKREESRNTRRVSRSRSRHSRDLNRVTNSGSSTNGTQSRADLIAAYEPSSAVKSELTQLIQSERAQYMKKKKRAHNKISAILNSMTPKQEHRYECWNRSVIPKNIVRTICNNALNRNSSSTSKRKSNIDEKSVIVMQALSKCLVMELVGRSREIQKETISKFLEHQQRAKEKMKHKENGDGEDGNNGMTEIEDINPPHSMMEGMNDIESKEGNQQNDADSMEKGEDVVPPPFLLEDTKVNESENGDESLKEDTKDTIVDDEKQEIGVQIFGDLKDETVNGRKESDSDLEPEIKEEYVLGPIRPIHVREALRSLQRDRSSFFHRKPQMFGSAI